MESLSRNQDAYSKFSSAVETPLLVLAIIWLPALIWPIVAHPNAATRETLEGIDYFVWAVFAVEYLLRLYLVPQRRRFVRTHLLDLLVVVVPLLRPVRALRVLKLLRVDQGLFVAGEILRRAKDILTHKSLHFVLLAVLVLVFSGAAVGLSFEHTAPGSSISNYGSALWWALVTVTTIGHSDLSPVTNAGKGLGLFLTLVGLGLIGIVTATLASYFVEKGEDSELNGLQERLERIEALLRAQSTAPSEDSEPAD